MQRRFWALVLGLSVLSVLSVFLGLNALNQTRGAEPANKKKVLRHVVLYKFKDGVTPAQLQEVISAFSGLPKQIEGIVGFEHGPNVSTEGKSDGLTYGFFVTFQNEKALAAYLLHPAHQAYVNVVRDRREKVVVFDYWADVP